MPGTPVILEGSYWEERLDEACRLAGCESRSTVVREALDLYLEIAKKVRAGDKVFVGVNRLGAPEMEGLVLNRVACLGEAERRLRGE